SCASSHKEYKQQNENDPASLDIHLFHSFLLIKQPLRSLYKCCPSNLAINLGMGHFSFAHPRFFIL
ncbi:hypothetical protein, partial [Thermoactinomyces sp. CICC 23799]|uniref:hypothetical protein n=1 Tax=Thermoactinomyces sp. CICC 23799 TaxID=2767429 RepID=UPI001E2D7289